MRSTYRRLVCYVLSFVMAIGQAPFIKAFQSPCEIGCYQTCVNDLKKCADDYKNRCEVIRADDVLVATACSTTYNDDKDLCGAIAATSMSIHTALFINSVWLCAAAGPGYPACEAAALTIYLAKQAMVLAAFALCMQRAGTKYDDCITTRLNLSTALLGQALVVLLRCQEDAMTKMQTCVAGCGGGE